MKKSIFLKDKRVLYFALILIILFLIPYPKLKYRYFFEALSNAVHFPLFLLITLAALRFFKEVNKTKLIIVLLLLPALIELIQPLFGRGGSVIDLISGYLGVVLVLLFRITKNLFIRLIIFLEILYFAVIYVFLPLALEYETLKLQKEKFPILYNESFNFAGLLPAVFWIPKDICLDCNSGNAAYVITLPQKYSGLEYKANGFDWSVYKKLIIKIDLPNTEQTMINVRVDDAKKCKEFEDRYNGQFKLVKGLNIIEIPFNDIIHGPESRVMDLSYVERMLIFVKPEENSLEFIIREVLLE